MFTVDLQALKEPRGFIRLLQVVFAVLAFTVACSYEGSSRFTVTCGKDSSTFNIKMVYPFDQKWIMFTPPKSCKNQTAVMMQSVACGIQSKAEFFVTMGVLSLFICLIALPVYVCKTALYENSTWIPLTDFGVTAIVAFLWLISTCIWFDATVELKNYANSKRLMEIIPACKTDKCGEAHEDSYSKLSISILLGFINIILWAGSSWFVYKDTKLHFQPEETTAGQPPPTDVATEVPQY